MNWLRIATALVRPAMALVDAIRDARRERKRERAAKDKADQAYSDLLMLERLIRENRELQAKRR